MTRESCNYKCELDFLLSLTSFPFNLPSKFFIVMFLVLENFVDIHNKI